MSDPVLLRTAILLKMDRWPDRKMIYVDPAEVVLIEPSDPALHLVGTTLDEVTALRLYGLGGTVLVYGNADANALIIQRARYAMGELTLSALVGLIEDEVGRKQPKSSLN